MLVERSNASDGYRDVYLQDQHQNVEWDQYNREEYKALNQQSRM